MQNLTYDKIAESKILMAALIIFIIALIFMIIMQIIVFVVYIKTSWIDRENSKNKTGGELARNILDQEGMSETRIISSFFYVKYWNHSRIRNTFRLRPWTVNRRSLWTMTEAAQQTVVSTWRKQKGRKGLNFTIFRVPTFLSIISVLISLCTVFYLFIALNTVNGIDLSSSKGKQIVGIAIFAITIVATLVAWADVIKMKIIRKHVLPILEKQGFTKQEIKKFNLIYTSRLLLAISIAIYNTIRLILMIVNAFSGKRSK